MNKNKRTCRDLALEQTWRKRLGRQVESGLSIGAFCREHGLSEASFHFWKRELRVRDAERLLSPGFVELHPAKEPVRDQLELVLEKGRRLLFPAGCDVQWLCRLVHGLEGKTC